MCGTTRLPTAPSPRRTPGSTGKSTGAARSSPRRSAVWDISRRSERPMPAPEAAVDDPESHQTEQGSGGAHGGRPTEERAQEKREHAADRVDDEKLARAERLLDQGPQGGEGVAVEEKVQKPAVQVVRRDQSPGLTVKNFRTHLRAKPIQRFQGWRKEAHRPRRRAARPPENQDEQAHS